MMSKEAMKLALEALEWEEAQTAYPSRMMTKAITALQKALANEALDKMAENARELGLDYEPVCNKDPQGCWSVRCQLGKKCKNTPAQQEPYGYVSTHTSGLMHFNKTFQGVYTDTATEIVAVYTTPPAAQRTWVGLTDEVCNAFLQGIRYAANKYEAVSDERFTGGDVSNFLLMEAEELDSSDIVKALEAAHGIKENT
jgi:hypothetical protein